MLILLTNEYAEKMMKFLIAGTVSFLVALPATELYADSSQVKGKQPGYSWRPVTVNGGGYTNFVITDPASPQVIYAGVDVGGIYKSYDSGEHWLPFNRGLVWPTDRLPAALTIDPKSGNLYFGAGGFNKGGIFKLTRDSESWELLTRKVKFNSHDVKHTRGKNLIVIDPADSNVIYAGSYDDGIFKSTDGGKTWVQKGLGSRLISSIVLNPSDPQIVYAAVAEKDTQDGGIYKSVDGGNNWKKISVSIHGVFQLAIDNKKPNTIYAACGNQGIFKTTDGGNTWEEKNKGLEGLISSRLKLSSINFISFDIDPENTEILYTGSGKEHGQIYKSTDGGNHWRNITADKASMHPGGWWKVQEIHWPGGRNYSANSLSVDPHNVKRIYVSGRSGIWRSDDAGMTWHAKVKGLGATCMQKLIISSKNPDVFFVGDADWVMFRTKDGGKTFERPLKGIGNWDIEESKKIWQKYKGDRGMAFAIDPGSDPETIYLGTAGSGRNSGTVFKSTDGGETWSEANRGLPVASVLALETDPSNHNSLFAILRGHGLYKSINGGNSWEKININVHRESKKMFQEVYASPILIHPKSSQIMYILEKKNGIYKTINGGKDWEIINGNLPQKGIQGMDQFVGGLALDPGNPDIVYAGLRRNGVYKTVNGGKNWQKITPSHIHHGGAISIDPFDNSVYLASVPGVGDEDIEGFIPGIYKSADGGKSWFPIHDDNLCKITLKITFMTAHKGKIYLSTQGNGIVVGEKTH